MYPNILKILKNKKILKIPTKNIRLSLNTNPKKFIKNIKKYIFKKILENSFSIVFIFICPQYYFFSYPKLKIH